MCKRTPQVKIRLLKERGWAVALVRQADWGQLSSAAQRAAHVSHVIKKAGVRL